MKKEYDLAIIGGGYYGGFAAYILSKKYPKKNIVIIEKADKLFTLASSTNQGQLHRGYVYSADACLARDCVREEPAFRELFPEAISTETESFYAVHNESEINAADYEAFCQDVGLTLAKTEMPQKEMFDQVTAVYRTPEKTFNNTLLQKEIRRLINRPNITILYQCQVDRILPDDTDYTLMTSAGDIQAHCVINASFEAINWIHEKSNMPQIDMRYDSFLHFIIKLPDEYKNLSMSVVRGQYCFVVPSKDRGGHTFASAKYRRVGTGVNKKLSTRIDEDTVMKLYHESIKECSKYVPVLRQAQYIGYTFGVRVAKYIGQDDTYTSKVVFEKNYSGNPNYHVLLGGKVSALPELISLFDSFELP